MVEAFLLVVMVTVCGGALATTPATTPGYTAEGITVTFEGEECVIDAPERVPAGRISIDQAMVRAGRRNAAKPMPDQGARS